MSLDREAGTLSPMDTRSSSDPALDGRTAALLLAAGGGSRFGGAEHKLLARLRGRRVIDWALDAVLGAGFADVIVVTGAVALDLPRGVHEVHHAGWADGQAGSLQAGLRAATALGAERVVVGLADQPFVEAACWRAVAVSRSRPMGVATYAGVRGNPVRLDASIWPLLPTSGDTGARALARLRPELVEEVPCSGSAADIDTLEDLRRWT